MCPGPPSDPTLDPWPPAQPDSLWVALACCRVSTQRLTFVPGDNGLGCARHTAGQLDCLAQLSCAVGQFFFKIGGAWGYKHRALITHTFPQVSTWQDQSPLTNKWLRQTPPLRNLYPQYHTRSWTGLRGRDRGPGYVGSMVGTVGKEGVLKQDPLSHSK